MKSFERIIVLQFMMIGVMDTHFINVSRTFFVPVLFFTGFERPLCTFSKCIWMKVNFLFNDPIGYLNLFVVGVCIGCGKPSKKKTSGMICPYSF